MINAKPTARSSPPAISPALRKAGKGSARHDKSTEQAEQCAELRDAPCGVSHERGNDCGHGPSFWVTV